VAYSEFPGRLRDTPFCECSAVFAKLAPFTAGIFYPPNLLSQPIRICWISVAKNGMALSPVPASPKLLDYIPSRVPVCRFDQAHYDNVLGCPIAGFL